MHRSTGCRWRHVFTWLATCGRWGSVGPLPSQRPAGLSPCAVMCVDRPPLPPQEPTELCTVVADDVIVMHWHADVGKARVGERGHSPQ